MEFKFRGFDTQTQHNQVYRTPFSSSSSYTYFSDNATQAGLWIGRSVGGGQVGPEILPEPADMRGAFQRELEKERIREEILAEEIARKRVLEAEVRKELMIEREMTAMRGGLGFPSSFMLAPPPSHNNWFEPGMPHGQPFAPADRRIALSFEEKVGGSGRPHREIGGFEVVPFQRLPRSPKISLPEDGKREVIGLGKPNNATLSGAKRRPPPPPSPAAAGSSEPCSFSSKKKPKVEWSCAVCEISVTCERGINEHLAGKKHQAKVAALRANNTGANLGLGVAPKKPTTMPAKLLKRKRNPVKATPLEIKNSSKSVSNDSEEDGKTEGEHMKQKFLFWCEMCHVGASTEKVINKHKKGKRHLNNLLKLNGKAGGQAAAGTQKAHDSEENPKGETMVVSDKVIGGEDKESKEKTEVADSGSIRSVLVDN